MKRLTSKRILIMTLCCVVASTSIAFGAKSVVKNISVTYSDIKLMVDGVEVTPKDSNGATVEPFIYNGTTYLPVRAVGQAVGKQVSWDGNTQTVYLGGNLGQKAYLMDVCAPYEKRETSVETMTMGGQTYNHGFMMYDAQWNGYAYMNLDGKYKTMEFDFGAIDGSTTQEISYEIYLDGQLVKTITHEPEQMVKHYSIPLNYALQLKIVGASAGNYARCGFANITVE